MVLLAYYALFLSDWGNFFHGSGPAQLVLVLLAQVLAIYSLASLAKVQGGRVWKVLCYVLVIPPVLALLFFLGSAIRNVGG
jgi:hypothetical protein